MKKIDLNTYNRKEIYEHFSNVDHPFYSITMPIDVTNLYNYSKKNKYSFYHLMVWLVSKTMNNLDNFKLRIINNELYLLDKVNPSFTHMNKGEEIFKIITVLYSDDFNKFDLESKELESTQKTLFSKSDTDDLIFISCLPWLDFTALTNERSLDINDAIPRVAWGKYYNENDKLFIHLSLDVNHRTIDGYHIGLFKEELDKQISLLK